MIEGRIQSQNLINQTSDASYRPPNFYKAITFDILTVLSALCAGYAYSRYLNSTASFIFFFAAFGVFLILSTLQVFFINNFSRRLMVMIFETASFLVYFWSYDITLLQVSAVIILGFYFWGTLSAYRERKNSLNIKFFSTTRTFLGKIVTAFSFILVVLYSPQLNQKNVFISEKIFERFFTGTAGFVGNFYPGYNINSSFHAFAQSIAKNQLQNNPTFQALPESQKPVALGEATSQTMTVIGQKLGIKVLPEESMSQFVYDLIVKTLNDWRDNFSGWFTIGWIIVVFFIVRGFGSIFSLFISFISFILYQILIASNFVHIVSEPTTKEMVEF